VPALFLTVYSIFNPPQGSGPPYTQAVANIRLIGVMLAHLVLFLHVRKHLIQLYSLRYLIRLQLFITQGQFQVPTENCHIAGHSLGNRT